MVSNANADVVNIFTVDADAKAVNLFRCRVHHYLTQKINLQKIIYLNSKNMQA